MIRTFLAVELSEPLRANLAKIQRELKQRLSGELSRDVRMSWVQATSIHLTLKFLGDIDEQVIAPMHAAMGNILSVHRAIEIPLERLGAFPRPQQPRVLWIGPSEEWERSREQERLMALHREIETCAQSLNFAPDNRPLSPHLTLARIKEGERSAGQALARSGVMDRPLTVGTLSVSAIALMKSDLKPTGSVYTRLWEVRVGENSSEF